MHNALTHQALQPSGAGEMAARIRSHDWSATPLGPIESWPQSLTTVVQIMLASPGPVSILWGSERIQLYNDAYIAIAAERHPDALGRPAQQIWSEAHEPFLGPVLDRAFAGETVTVDEHAVPLRTVGGEVVERFFSGSFLPVRDQSGSVVGVFHPLIEVTATVHAGAALRQQEENLRESEARVRALTDNLPAGMVYQIATGADGSERRFLYVSQSHEKLTGVPADAVLADPTIPYQLILPEDRGRLVEAEAEAVRTNTNFDVEVRFRRADGELRWCRIISAPRAQEDGSIIWDGIQIDTTDQKSTEAALRESEAHLTAVFEQSAAGLTETDSTGRFLKANDRYCEIVGRGREELLRLRMQDITHADDLPANLPLFLRSREMGEPFDIEKRYVRPDGSVVWVHNSVTTLRENQSRSATTLCVSVDVTERKAIEAALRDLNDTLESRVAERTAELSRAHDQLRQSQKLEAMGQLTGGVSHDFNNLLSPIIGSLDLLQRRGIGGEREQRLIDGALQSAERAKVLVQRLLAFARRQPLQPVPVDVGALVAGMADLVASTTGPQIEVVVDVSDKLPAAIADPNQIEMAILNLAVNARDAMAQGGTLRISVKDEAIGVGRRSDLTPGRYVRLSVADTGAGMDEATLERAIEPFFSTKGVGRGTGLGLSMVHGLAAQLGGALAIRSQPGLGTNVEIWLPASDEAALEPDRAEDEVAQSGAGTVLLVDDEELVRSSTADMLTDLGYLVVEAGSAAAALRLVEEELLFNVLVTDHLMPGMTGTELAREVRGRRPDAGVLVISGYAEVDGIAPDMSRLTKPFRQVDLAAKLAELDRGRPADA